MAAYAPTSERAAKRTSERLRAGPDGPMDVVRHLALGEVCITEQCAAVLHIRAGIELVPLPDLVHVEARCLRELRRVQFKAGDHVSEPVQVLGDGLRWIRDAILYPEAVL